MKFRVWCLSWHDTEDEGRDIVGYDPAAGLRERTQGREIRVAFYNLASPGEAAEIYASWSHRNRDGYESTWPLTFRVRSEDGTVQDFEVEREMEPTFSAHPLAQE